MPNKFIDKLINKIKKSSVSINIVSALIIISFIPLWLTTLSQFFLRIPANFYLENQIISINNYYNSESESYSGEEFNVSNLIYESVGSTRSTITLRVIFDDQTSSEENRISSENLYQVDRYTGELISDFGNKNRQGYLYAPRDLSQNDTFKYWHVKYDQPAEMNYSYTETLKGLDLFVFESDYKDITIDKTRDLQNISEVGTEKGVRLDPYVKIWIEPETGLIIKFQDESNAYFYDLSSGEELAPWNKISNRTSEDSVDENLATAASLKVVKSLTQELVSGILFIVAIIVVVLDKKVQNILKKYITENRIQVLAATTIIIFASIILAGWALNNDILLKLAITGEYSTNPLTALLFLLVGIVLLFGRKINNYLLLAISFVIFVIPLINILGEVGMVNLQLDQVLFSDNVAAIDSHMSLFTSLLFMLMGIVILLTIFKFFRRFNVDIILTALVMDLSFLVVVGYILNLFLIFNTPFFDYTSLTTAILFIVAGIGVVILYRKREFTNLNPINTLIIYGALLLSITSTMIFTEIIEQNFLSEEELVFSNQVENVTDSISDRLSIYINVVEGTEGLLASSVFVERDEWREYIETIDISQNYPGMEGIGYTLFIDPDQLQTHIQEIRSSDYPEYNISPLGNRDIYSSILYFEPQNENTESIIGFDLFIGSATKIAMEHARDSEESTLTAKIDNSLVDIWNDKQPRVFIFVPFYNNDNITNSVAERRSEINGYSFGVINISTFLKNSIGEDGIENIGLEVSDGVIRNDNTLLYSDLQNKINKTEDAKFSSIQTIFIDERPWTLRFYSTSDYGENSYTRSIPLIIVTFGVFITTLIGILLYIILSTRQELASYATEVTRDLKKSKATSDAIIQNIGNGLIATNSEGMIITVNKAFEDLLGFYREEVLGKKIVNIVKVLDEDGNLIKDSDRLFNKVLEEDKVISTDTNDKVFYQREDGSTFPVATTISPIKINDNMIGIAVIFRDVTHELAVNRAKSEFVSLASHQLRTPLTGIRWYTELFLKEPTKKLTKKQISYLESIKESSVNMAELIEALLNASRIELNTFGINPEPTDLILLFNEVLDSLRPLINKKNQQIIVNNDELPMTEVDPKLFKIIYQNVLSNAIKYTPKKGKIKISHELKKDFILITVEDNGYGIPKDQQNEIFSKMFRADNIKDKDTTGTGLGLYIVKAIIEQTNGKIWFESEEDKGTKFFIEIPIKGMKKRTGGKLFETK